MLVVPSLGRDFGWILSSHGNSTRPTTSMGQSVTPGNNTKGSWVQLFSAIANQAYAITIMINNNSVSSAARDAIVDIGIDEAGGTSYSVKIPDLLGSCATTVDKTGVMYHFPLGIKAGSTIAARASVNNATVGALRVWAMLYGLPKYPELCRYGSYVTAYGITSGSSAGTSITPGTTSEGSWTSLGTTSQPHWWWQQGMGINNSSMNIKLYTMDLGIGDGSNKQVVILDQLWGTDSSERVMNTPVMWGCEYDAPSGVGVYGRMQCHSSVDTGISMAAYGLGG